MLKYPRQASERRRELVCELLASIRGGVPIIPCVAPPKCDALMCQRICKGDHDPDPPGPPPGDRP